MKQLVPTARLFTPLAGLTILAAEPAAPQASSVVEVSVHSSLPREGLIRIALFGDPQTFPDEPIQSVVLPTGPDLTGDSTAHVGPSGEAPIAQWRFSVPPGVYAVAAIHDRNGNGRLDTNLLGMPKEPYGFSRAARGRFGPPSFEDAAFVVELPLTSVRVEVR